MKVACTFFKKILLGGSDNIRKAGKRWINDTRSYARNGSVLP